VLERVRAIAFDLDNTLWDVEPVLRRAETILWEWLQGNCPRIAQHLSSEDMRAARERLARAEPHNAHDFSYLRLTALKSHAREHGYEETLAGAAFEVFLAARNEVTLYPDVAAALERLGRRYVLASLSNGNADLERIGLGHRFAVSLNARQIGAAKPERRCFEQLAQKLALSAGEIAYVGDDPHLDVVAARAAGFHSVWVNRRKLAWPQELAAADLTVADCAELAAACGC
jgi:FMN hydrolase / 5-amino-6-(5-phospho-D-ribitylamino)uracil phosphatase